MKSNKTVNKELTCGFKANRKHNYVCPQCGGMRRWPNAIYGIPGGVEVTVGGHTYYYPKCGKCGVKMEDFGEKSDSVLVGKLKPAERAALAQLDWLSRLKELRKMREKAHAPRSRKVTPDQNPRPDGSMRKKWRFR